MRFVGEEFAVYWDYFDKIYCISLDERPDRQKEARLQFNDVGLSKKVEFVIVKKHPDDCEQGIYESHVLCMKKGIQAGADTILIFEDDICFNRFNPEILGNAVNFLSANDDWKILFLGCMVKKSEKTKTDSVLKVKFRSLSHGYVLNRRFAETLVKRTWQNIAFDDMLRDLKDDHLYAIYPCFAFQSKSRSDNQRYLRLDTFRRLCGGLERLQKMNEFYHYNRTLIIGAHILFVLIFVILLATWNWFKG